MARRRIEEPAETPVAQQTTTPTTQQAETPVAQQTTTPTTQQATTPAETRALPMFPARMSEKDVMLKYKFSVHTHPSEGVRYTCRCGFVQPLDKLIRASALCLGCGRDAKDDMVVIAEQKFADLDPLKNRNAGGLVHGCGLALSPTPVAGESVIGAMRACDKCKGACPDLGVKFCLVCGARRTETAVGPHWPCGHGNGSSHVTRVTSLDPGPMPHTTRLSHATARDDAQFGELLALDSVTVTHGQEVYNPKKYHTYTVGPFTTTVTVRAGETRAQAGTRALLELEEIASADRTRKLAHFMKAIGEMARIAKGAD